MSGCLGLIPSPPISNLHPGKYVTCRVRMVGSEMGCLLGLTSFAVSVLGEVDGSGLMGFVID